jgi:hypothetical protein
MSTHPACIRGARGRRVVRIPLLRSKGVIASSPIQAKNILVEFARIQKRFSVSNFARMIRCEAMMVRPRSLAAIESDVLGNSATRHEKAWNVLENSNGEQLRES